MLTADEDQSTQHTRVAAVLDHGWWTMPQNAMMSLLKQWTWLEISWLLLSAFGISHLQQQNSFYNSVMHSTWFLWNKY